MVSDLDAALSPFLAAPATAAILLDFDGVLAPIVDDPAAARPLEGTAELLSELAARYKVVGVVSGRPVSFLQPLLPPGLVLSGLYGLEVVDNGTRTDHPQSGAWREVIEDVARCSVDRGPQGMVVETKGLSLTLHYRTHPELAAEVQGWATHQAARSGLVYRPAKMSVELHPPIDADKGTAVEAIAKRASAVCFVGDDVGDLAAYDALDRLAEQGVHTLRVAVRSDETAAELLRRADLVVDGPEAVVDLLRRLAATGAEAEQAKQ
ncbi:MAG TPA: trehalose-phosphatase [Acidimicrobiales bacterium]